MRIQAQNPRPLVRNLPLLALLGAVSFAGAATAQHLDTKEKSKGRNGGDYSFDLRVSAGQRISKMEFAGNRGFTVYQQDAVFRSGRELAVWDNNGRRTRVGATWDAMKFEIPKGDYLKKATISWKGGLTLANFLTGIRVTTASGKSITYGTMSPRPSPSRHYFEKDGYEIAGFHGKATTSGIYMLGVYWRKLNEATIGEKGQSSPVRVLPDDERVGAVTAHFYSAGTKLGGVVFEGRKPGGAVGTTLRWNIMSSVPMRFEIPVDDYLSQFDLLRDSQGIAVGVRLRTFRGLLKTLVRASASFYDHVNYPDHHEVVGLVGDPRGLDKDQNIVRVLRVRRGQTEYYTGRSQCPGNNRLWGMASSPKVGSQLTFAVTGTQIGIAFIGFEKAEIPLPGACDLLVKNPLMLPMPIYRPLKLPAVFLSIPDVSSMFMARLYGQALCVEEGPTFGIGTMTQGIEFSIGAR